MAAGGAGGDILVFRHPVAGTQLVKGTVEAGESPAEAALRELREEAGVSGVLIAGLGSSADIAPGQLWTFFLCHADDLPEHWTHHTTDGGGLDFAFGWWPVARPAAADWHPIFVRALAYAIGALGAR